MRLLTFSFLKHCKLKTISYRLPKRYRSENAQSEVDAVKVKGDLNLIEISPSWQVGEEQQLRATVLQDMQVIPNFLSEDEEANMLAELEPCLKKMRYEYDHWDNAIIGFRETERSVWRDDNAAVLARVKSVAFPPSAVPLEHAHVLDLAAAGYIKPHVDAVRFCGDVIAGLCLASSAVMRLEHSAKPQLALHALLARRSLYVMKGEARYAFSHAVLGGERSAWRGEPVPRRRRVAVICRTRPAPAPGPGPGPGPGPDPDPALDH